VGHGDPRDGRDGFFVPAATFTGAAFTVPRVGRDPEPVLGVGLGSHALVIEVDPLPGPFPASSASGIRACPIVLRMGDLGRHRPTRSRCGSRRPARRWTDRIGLALLSGWASNALPDGWLVELARLLFN
jgi:hypothetical protein